MRYRVDEVSLHRDTGFLYLSLSFWATAAGQQAGNPPRLQNDFIIQVPPAQVQQVIINAQGQIQGADGQWYDQRGSDGSYTAPPSGGWATQTVTIDRLAYVRGVIASWVQQAVAAQWRGDIRDPSLPRTSTDPNGLLALFSNWQSTLSDA